MSTSPPKEQSASTPRKTPTSNAPNSQQDTAKQDPTTPVARKGDTPSKPKPAGSNASNRSAKFVDVSLHDETDDPSFQFIHHKDAQHSSYNSHANHKWKYKEEADGAVFEEAKDAVAEAGESFEKVVKDKNGASSRNGSADRPEKYD